MACFIGLLCLLWGIVFADYELNRYTPHGLRYETITFDHYSIDGRCLDLYVQGKRRPLWVIDPDTALFDPEAFLAACDRGEAFAVTYRNEHISRNASPSYPLYNITSADGQTVYMAIERLRERALPQRPSRIALCFTPFAIWLVFCGFGILVARHPAMLGGKPFRRLFVDEPKSSTAARGEKVPAERRPRHAPPSVIITRNPAGFLQKSGNFLDFPAAIL